MLPPLGGSANVVTFQGASRVRRRSAFGRTVGSPNSPMGRSANLPGLVLRSGWLATGLQRQAPAQHLERQGSAASWHMQDGPRLKILSSKPPLRGRMSYRVGRTTGTYQSKIPASGTTCGRTAFSRVGGLCPS